MWSTKRFGSDLWVFFLLSLFPATVFGDCENSWVVPRLAAGEFNGVAIVPSLTFKNLSDKRCDGKFSLLTGDSETALGQFEFGDQTILDGTIDISLAPGEGLFARLRRIGPGGFQGYGVWRQKGQCVAERDVVLTADMRLAVAQDDGTYEVVDQIGINAGAKPQQGWGFPVRRTTLPQDAGAEATAFALASCGTGPYEWTVDFYDHSGIGKLTRRGSSSGPIARFIHEIFASELPNEFNGYATVFTNRPAYLEALTVVSGPRVQGGVQLSNFPIQVAEKSPFAKHAYEKQLQEALHQVVSSHGIRGSSVAVKMPGQPIWTGVSGNSTPTEPISPHTLFGIASITKTYIAALTLKLADEGVLNLEDPLSRWLPEYPNVNSGITIRQLLDHTSGLYNYEFNPALVGALFGGPEESWTPEELLTFVLSPSFPPGTAWEYSNTNYLLLGMIVRTATGSEVSTELRRQFLTPLGLSDTFLLSEESAPRALAHSWSDWDRDGQFQDVSPIETSLFSAAWTAGGLVSTSEDVVNWTVSLFEGNILSQTHFQKMIDFHPLDPATTGITGYGLGIQEFRLNEHVFWGHGGNMPGWNTFMLYEPSLRLSIAVLFNQDSVGQEASVALVEAILNAIRPGLPAVDY